VADPGAKERILEVAPGLDELIAGGSPGEQIQTSGLAVGDATDAWVLWFVRQALGLVVLTPVASVREDAVDEARRRCNAHNGALQWAVLHLADWDGDQVASLSVRLPLLPREDDLWDAVGTSMQYVLENAPAARATFADLAP
jgi:hypothetical protein